MKILCVFGKHNYGRPERGEGYEFTNFLPALQRLGHETILFDSFTRAGYESFADLNRAFLAAIDRHSPDVILCVLMHYELWLETLNLVRERTNCVVINWSTDDSWKYAQFSRFIAPAFDIYATTSAAAIARSRRDGMSNFVLTQWAANSAALCAPLSAGQCRYGVSFVGTAYGARPAMIAGLKRAGIEVACFGHGWPHGAVAADVIPKIIRESAISLNFGDSPLVINGWLPHRSRQIKARVFEVPGAGGFLLTEKADGLEQYYSPGTEIVVFDGMHDLAEKIHYYLDNTTQRDRIATAGHQRTRDEHTYEQRFQSLLAAANTLRARSGRRYEPCADAERFAALMRMHKPGVGLRLLRTSVTKPATLIWGPRRGPRAARRFMFEISWRLAGRKTYSASGWPGRLFYAES